MPYTPATLSSSSSSSSLLTSSHSQDRGLALQSNSKPKAGPRRRSFNFSKLPGFSREMMLASVKDVPLPQPSPSVTFASSPVMLSDFPSKSPATVFESSSSSHYRSAGEARSQLADTPGAPDYLISPDALGLQERQGFHGYASSEYAGVDDEFDIPTPRPRHPDQSPVLDYVRISEAISNSRSRKDAKSPGPPMSRKNSSSSSGSGFRAYLAGTLARRRSKTLGAAEHLPQAEAPAQQSLHSSDPPNYLGTVEHFKAFSSGLGIDSRDFFKELDKSLGRKAEAKDLTLQNPFVPSSQLTVSTPTSPKSPQNRRFSLKRRSTMTNSTLEDTPPTTPRGSERDQEVRLSALGTRPSDEVEYGIPEDPFRRSPLPLQRYIPYEFDRFSSGDWPSDVVEEQEDYDNQLTPVARSRLSSYDFSIYESRGPNENATYIPHRIREFSRSQHLQEAKGGIERGIERRQSVETVERSLPAVALYDYINCMGLEFPLPPKLPENYHDLTIVGDGDV